MVPIQRTQPVKKKKILENITEVKNDQGEEAVAEVRRNETTKTLQKEETL